MIPQHFMWPSTVCATAAAIVLAVCVSKRHLLLYAYQQHRISQGIASSPPTEINWWFRRCNCQRMVLVPLHSLDQLFGTSYLTISEIRHSPLTFSTMILKLSCLLTTDWRRSSALETLSDSALYKCITDWLIDRMIDWLTDALSSSSSSSSTTSTSRHYHYYYSLLIIGYFYYSFSALTLLVGRQEEHLTCKNLLQQFPKSSFFGKILTKISLREVNQCY